VNAVFRPLVATCHRREAYAIGGMSAFIPDRSSPATTERAIVQVRAEKLREATLGYDGTWVAHPTSCRTSGRSSTGCWASNPTSST
jgi:malate synthase